MKKINIKIRKKNYNYSLLIGSNLLNILPKKLKIISPKAQNVAVVFDKKMYFGSDAINIISILGKKVSFINNIMIGIFKHRVISQLLYPLLKLGRRLLLLILGKKLI